MYLEDRVQSSGKNMMLYCHQPFYHTLIILYFGIPIYLVLSIVAPPVWFINNGCGIIYSGCGCRLCASRLIRIGLVVTLQPNGSLVNGPYAVAAFDPEYWVDPDAETDLEPDTSSEIEVAQSVRWSVCASHQTGRQ